MSSDDRRQIARRGFFRDALVGVVGPAADYIESLGSPADKQKWLRPPGAVAEDEFLDKCQRCGACVTACPANAIAALNSPDPRLAQTPVIRPSIAACVVCEGLLCTHACPSGALLPLIDPRMIQMGLAVVSAAQCVRSRGESCTECVDKCPLGLSAIRFNDAGPPEVLAEGCTGCGVCELYCPTTPKAIIVEASRPSRG